MDQSQVIATLSAGSIAGLSSDVITHPISTVKARIYTQSNTGFGAVQMLRNIAVNEGWQKLYTGFSANIGAGPGRALYFGGAEFAKHVGGRMLGDSNHPLVHTSSGMFAQLCGSVVWVPMDVLKERMQVQTSLNNKHNSKSSAACGRKDVYRNPLHAARVICANEGAGALYRGFLAHQLLWGPFNAIFWPLYEKSKAYASSKIVARSGDKEGSGYSSAYVYPVCALFSGVVAGAVTNPVDLVKVRLQVDPSYKGALDCLMRTLREEHVSVLYRGVSARSTWIGCNMMLTFAIYDFIRDNMF